MNLFLNYFQFYFFLTKLCFIFVSTTIRKNNLKIKIMAYISSSEVKEIRNELKAAFPQLKLSVTRENYSKLCVAIMEAPIKFTERSYEQLNHFYLERYENSEILEKIKAICNKTNYDKSDSMVDYFEVGYYFSLNVGKWDKDFKLVN